MEQSDVPVRCRLTRISVPDYVEEICDGCFYNCTNLRLVTFGEPSPLRRIGREAFSECLKLEEIRIPDSVEELGDSCFSISSEPSRCGRESRPPGFFSIQFGPSSSLKRTGLHAFEWRGLSHICIPNGVEELSTGCFDGCDILSSVELGQTLKRIGASAFGRCSRLRIIDIPDSVGEIRNICFYRCKHLHVRFGQLSSLNRIIGSAN